jgi:hypothetical protein
MWTTKITSALPPSMTTQEKIAQLAAAALCSAPSPRKAPTPTTFMAPFGKPRIVGLVGRPPAADVDRNGSQSLRDHGPAKA